METTTVLIPYVVETALMLTVAMCLILGVVAIIAWKMQAEGKLSHFFGGMFMYAVFTACMKSILDVFMAPLVVGSFWGYGIYEGLMWTVLQTLGIYFGFKYIHKDHSDRRLGVSFGLGFSWMQILLSAGVSSAMYYAFAISVNESGVAEMTAGFSEADLANFNDTLAYMQSLTLMDCVWSLTEVFLRMGLLTAVSVILLAAVRGEDTRKNLAVAMCLQLLPLIPVGWHQTGTGMPLWITEIIMAMAMACAVVYAKRLYDEMPVPRRTSRRTKYL